ncbi:MAG: polysaccharide deacetylase family protein [bacterium]|nr:polysaccharide deacetylase family protein [bacterium]
MKAVQFLTFLLLCLSFQAYSQLSPSSQTRLIAVTIDDAPHNGPIGSLVELALMTKKFTETLKSQKIPAVVFVNEGQLYYSADDIEEKIAILRSWIGSGIELGNHTFGHVGLKDTPLEAYQDDFIRGEVVSRRIASESKTPLRYFRHPFLQMGPTRDIEELFEAFLAKRAYRSVPITLTTEDWMFLPAYQKAKDATEKKRISDDYLSFAEADVAYREKAANRMFGRPIPHILLVHANAVTADNLTRLIEMYQSRGYKFISVEEALKDPAYANPEKYSPTSDWLRGWSISKAIQFDPPQPPEYIRAAATSQ